MAVRELTSAPLLGGVLVSLSRTMACSEGAVVHPIINTGIATKAGKAPEHEAGKTLLAHEALNGVQSTATAQSQPKNRAVMLPNLCCFMWGIFPRPHVPVSRVICRCRRLVRCSWLWFCCLDWR
jgi:hypothetical protein